MGGPNFYGARDLSLRLKTGFAQDDAFNLTINLLHMNSEFSIRIASESDLDILLAFMREYYAFDGHGFDEEKARAAVVRLLRDPELGRVWIIEDAAPGRTRTRASALRRVGYIVICFGYSLEWLGRDAFIDEFYLHEEYRGRGWGRKTMEFVEREAQALGVTTLHLEVVKENSSALEIYRRVGFKEHSSTFMSKWIARGASKPMGKHGY